MTDPLERLRGLAPPASTPDTPAIRARAGRIRARRRSALSAASGVAVVIAAVAVVAARPDPVPTGVASGPARTPAAAESQTSAAADRESDAALPQDAARRAAPAPAVTAPAALAAGDAAVPGRAEAFASQPSLTLRLEVSSEPAVPGGGEVTMTLHVCNTTDVEIVERFGSSQRYDFEVSRSGSVVWRWSAGRAFAQSTAEERFAAGECRRFSERWDGTRDDGGPAAPGSYEAVGVLTSRTGGRTDPQRVCAVRCD